MGMFRTLYLFLASLLVLNECVSTHGQSTCQKNRLNAVKSGQQRVRGTNLGSWFILESGMVPRIWDENGCDKENDGGSYLLEKCLGKRAKSVMEKHWSSHITESDFLEMSRHGLNLVRLPVGWWEIYDLQGGADKANLNHTITPKNFTIGELAYIDKAFQWGLKNGIAILLDMHAAPGSQNGNQNSSPGVIGRVDWDKNEANVDQTIDSMDLYAQRYGKHPALFGFSLLNEPVLVKREVLQDYYKRAYARIRKNSPNSNIVLSPLNFPFESGTEAHWAGFMNPSQGYHNVSMDLHYYSCFGGKADQKDPDKAIKYITVERKNQIDDYIIKNPKPMLIGEWSSCGHFSTNRTREFTQAQVNVYNKAKLGWTFWSWIDDHPVWNMKTAFKSGWMDNIKESVC